MLEKCFCTKKKSKNFLFIKEFWEKKEKKKLDSTELLSSTAVSSIDNNKKCVLSTKSAY